MASLVLRPPLDLLPALVRPTASLAAKVSATVRGLRSRKRCPAHRFTETLKASMAEKKPTPNQVHPHWLYDPALPHILIRPPVVFLPRAEPA